MRVEAIERREREESSLVGVCHEWRQVCWGRMKRILKVALFLSAFGIECAYK